MSPNDRSTSTCRNRRRQKRTAPSTSSPPGPADRSSAPARPRACRGAPRVPRRRRNPAGSSRRAGAPDSRSSGPADRPPPRDRAPMRAGSGTRDGGSSRPGGPPHRGREAARRCSSRGPADPLRASRSGARRRRPRLARRAPPRRGTSGSRPPRGSWRRTKRAPRRASRGARERGTEDGRRAPGRASRGARRAFMPPPAGRRVRSRCDRSPRASHRGRGAPSAPASAVPRRGRSGADGTGAGPPPGRGPRPPARRR